MPKVPFRERKVTDTRTLDLKDTYRVFHYPDTLRAAAKSAPSQAVCASALRLFTKKRCGQRAEMLQRRSTAPLFAAGMPKLYPLLMSLRSLLLASCTLVALQACFSTHLQSFEPLPQLEQLVESSPTKIALHVQRSDTDSSAGNQFLFFIIPVTRVFPDTTEAIVRSKFITRAGLAGIGLTTTAENSPPVTPRIDVQIDSVAVSGYDLFVVRRPAASISLTATLVTHDGTSRRCSTSASYATFARFAFAKQLEQAIEEASDSAAVKALTCLGLTPELRELAAQQGQRRFS